jgi:rare lipoprotein A
VRHKTIPFAFQTETLLQAYLVAHIRFGMLRDSIALAPRLILKCFGYIFFLLATIALGGCSYSEHNPENIQPPQIIVEKQSAPAATASAPASKKAAAKKSDGPPLQDIDVSKIPDAVPKTEALSPYGNPEKYVANGHEYHVLKSAKNYDKTGIASWYGSKFNGLLTSTRETYDLAGMTAASTELPLPTYARVTNLENGKQVVVKVNDRGPFEKDRVIDLSYAAAKKLGYLGTGTALVRVEAIDASAGTDAMLAHDQPVKKVPNIYLQVGAFAQSNNAYSFKKQIAALTDKPVRITHEQINNKTIYRVQIGPLASVDENDSLHQKLSMNKISKVITIIE